MSDVGGFISFIGAPVPETGDGVAHLEMVADERHLNPAGTVHGGLLASLVDTVMGAAVSTMDGDGVPATSQLTVTYLRPGRPGRLLVRAAVSKQGENLTVCEGDVEQDGTPLVHALATFALVGG